jgi:hypothetical protein
LHYNHWYSFILYIASCGPNTDRVGDGECYIITGRFKLLIGIDALKELGEVYCEFLEATRAYLSGGDVIAQLPNVVTAVSSVITGSLVPTFCAIKTGQLSASTVDDVGATTGSDAGSKYKYIVTIVVGSVASVAVVAMGFLYMRYRKGTIDTQFVDRCTSGSDLEFQHSDETVASHKEPSQPRTAAVPDNNNKTVHENTSARQQQHVIPESQTEQEVIFSPTHTEQEIVFSPSSSLASSLLFRSP